MAPGDNRRQLRSVLALAMILLLPMWLGAGGLAFQQAALAETPDKAETDAFEAAKALGTVEAWDAFLAHYPSGFHADLARAYVKQLAGTPPAAVAPSTQATGPEQPAYEQTCQGQETLRSRHSDEPAKLRFINESGATLILQWIDYNGGLKEYATLKPGADIVQDTFVTHPWVVAYEEGSCRQIFLPAPGNSVARLLPESQGAKARDSTPPPKSTPRKKDDDGDRDTLKCAKGYKKVKGQCVMLQNCGANATRSAEGDCYCNKNYVMKNGQCVWKTDKQGFEVAPWKKPGCSTWKQQCSQGSAKACGNYEANCQVN